MNPVQVKSFVQNLLNPGQPANQAPAFKQWKLDSEPWVFVIDRSGVIRFRALGPVTATEIAAALQPLL